MIGLIQRVNHARVKVDDQTVGQIDKGILLLLGVEKTDDQSVVRKLADKILKLRIFSDDAGKMNLNLSQAKGSLLVVSQFTLVADTQKGNRPGFSNAAPPQLGEELYQHFTSYCMEKGVTCETGQFGADMQILLENDGPVTFHLQIN